MDLSFTPEQATQLLMMVSPLITVLATYLVGRTDMKAIIKIAIAFGVSTIMGGLTAFSQGQLVENLWSNLAVIFTASQGIYVIFFKGLQLENYLYPTEALVSKASDQVKNQLGGISPETASAILDPNNSVTLETHTNIYTASTPEPDKVE